MRIVYFLDNFIPQLNGVVTSAISNIKVLASLGCDILILIPSPSRNSLEKERLTRPEFIRKYEAALGNVRIICVPSVPFPFYPGLRLTSIGTRKIFRAVKGFKPDIIHFHTQLTLGLSAVRIAKRLGCRLIGSFHTFIAEPEYIRTIPFFRISGLDKSRLLQNMLWRYNNRFFYSSCDRVVAVSEYSKQLLVSRGIDQEKIEVVHNGISIRGKNVSVTYPEKLGNRRFLLYVGRISIEKSLEVLLAATKKVCSSMDRVNLLLVGDGPYKAALKRLVTDLGLERQVIFTGPVSNEELLNSWIYKKAEIFVTASKSEAQPVSILEAMSFGLPVVGVDSRGIPELLQYGNGIVVEPDNSDAIASAVTRLLKDRALYNRMSEKAGRAAWAYDRNKTSLEMYRLYNRSLSLRGGSIGDP